MFVDRIGELRSDLRYDQSKQKAVETGKKLEIAHA